MATNFSEEWLDFLLRKANCPDLFDARMVSDKVKAAKPDEDFWKAVLEVVPKGTLFVDDQKQNCEAAE